MMLEQATQKRPSLITPIPPYHELWASLKSTDRHGTVGTSIEDIKRFLVQHKIQYASYLPKNDLRANLAISPIALIITACDGRKHFILLIGADDNGFYYLDPAQYPHPSTNKRYMSNETFNQALVFTEENPHQSLSIQII
jgi:hypothetical protein